MSRTARGTGRARANANSRRSKDRAPARIMPVLRLVRGVYGSQNVRPVEASMKNGYLWIGKHHGPFILAICGRATLLKLAAMIRRYAR